jgi:hypothetical protein
VKCLTRLTTSAQCARLDTLGTMLPRCVLSPSFPLDASLLIDSTQHSVRSAKDQSMIGIGSLHLDLNKELVSEAATWVRR